MQRICTSIVLLLAMLGFSICGAHAANKPRRVRLVGTPPADIVLQPSSVVDLRELISRGEPDKPRHPLSISLATRGVVCLATPYTFCLFDTETGRVRHFPIQEERTRHFENLALSPDRTWLATTDGQGLDGTLNYSENPICVWQLETGKMVQSLDHPGLYFARSHRFSPDGKHVLFDGMWKDSRGNVFQWSLENGEISQFAYSRPGKRLGFGVFTCDGSLMVGVVRDNPPPPPPQFPLVGRPPNNTHLVVLDTATGQPQFVTSPQDDTERLHRVEIDPRRQRLVTGTSYRPNSLGSSFADGEITIIDLQTGRVTCRFQARRTWNGFESFDNVDDVSISRDGTKVLAVTKMGVHLLDIRPGHEKELLRFATPDYQRESEDGKTIYIFRCSMASFSPDESRVVGMVEDKLYTFDIPEALRPRAR